jgi:hypothetical protein
VTAASTDPDNDDLSATADTTVGVPPNVGGYFTVTPCRAVDTRTGSPLQDGVPQTFALAGVCGIPASATSVVVNLTAIQATGSGELAVHAADVAPPLFATLPFAAGINRALFAIPAISAAAGELTVVPSVAGAGTLHLLIDVMGYFEE